ncbi:MAG: NAD-dependent epimerase/dehydratase family protein, partial [Alphaproteobacteria bacterium]|nr:NAD-dependent epimerase/dehydratase family protein [Alphaproteobacteria bacterium]
MAPEETAARSVLDGRACRRYQLAAGGAGPATLPRGPAPVTTIPSADLPAAFRGAKVIITGGLGFIGSNLARRLVGLGADVIAVDSLIP